MARGRSSILAKQRYQASQPYTPIQKLNYVKCDCDPKGVPIGADEAAEFKLTGGYDTSPNNICQEHFIAKSQNGTCIECTG